MKLILLMTMTISLCLLSMDRPPSGALLFALDQSSPGNAQTVNVHDFIELNERVKNLCKKIPKITSHDLEAKIIRIHSEGDVAPLDCDSINQLIRTECSQAKALLLCASASKSVISTTLAEENYDQARRRFHNAFHHLIQAFALKCYKTMDTLHEVLNKFIDAEQAALYAQPKRKLDQGIQNLYPALEIIIKNAENKIQSTVRLIEEDKTKELVRKLEVPTLRTSSDMTAQSQSSLDTANAHLNAGRALLKNLQDPSLESLDNIERTFFLALDHFITAYYRDVNQGIEDAQTALKEIENVHTLKKNKYGKEGTRYALAKEKIAHALKSSPLVVSEVKEKSPIATNLHEEHSNTSSDFAKFLKEDATADDASRKKAQYAARQAVTEAPESARSHSKPINDSERAVKDNDTLSNHEGSPASDTQESSTNHTGNRVSLFHSAWKSLKKVGKSPYRGAKYVWKKMPFN